MLEFSISNFHSICLLVLRASPSTESVHFADHLNPILKRNFREREKVLTIFVQIDCLFKLGEFGLADFEFAATSNPIRWRIVWMGSVTENSFGRIPLKEDSIVFRFASRAGRKFLAADDKHTDKPRKFSLAMVVFSLKELSIKGTESQNRVPNEHHRKVSHSFRDGISRTI